MTGYLLLTPELVLLVAVVWAMFGERLPGGDRGAAWAGSAFAVGAAVLAAISPVGGSIFDGLLAADGSARLARVGMALLLALWLQWVARRGEGRIRESVVLASFATLGGLLMAEARELVTLLLAIELATMPAYVLIGYRRSRVNGLEGAIKYFLLSMLTTLIMLYGMSFLYGITSTTRLDSLADGLAGSGSLGLLAVLLTFVGLFAKLSAAPFHYWAPDAYEGSEAWTVAFVSTVPKVAGAVVLVRITAAVAGAMPALGPVLVAVAAASMVLGNLAALTQTDVRRMMAYSGVAHTGYMTLAAASLSATGYGAAVLYSVAYAIPSLGIMLVAAEEGPLLTDFAGLSRRRAATAWTTVVMLVSLIGIPPMIGFFGKFLLFASAWKAGLGAWVVLAVAMSVVSAGYYLRIVREAFFGGEAEGAEKAAGGVSLGVVGCAVVVFALGLASGPVMSWMGLPLP